MTGTRRGTFGLFAAALSIVVAIFVAAACADRQSNGGTPTRPLFRSGGSEGGVTGDVDREVVIRTGGTTYSFDVGDSTVYAPFQGGWAWSDNEVGVPSALGVMPDAYVGATSGADTLVDSLSNVHIVSFTASSSPPSHIQHFINGELRSDRTVLWVSTEDGWVMSETYLEVYTEEGDTVSLWTSLDGQIASAGFPALDALRDIALAPIMLLRPAPLAAQHYWACRGQWGLYIVASLALDAAIEVAILAPNLVTVEAFLAAAGAWGAALDNLLDCFDEHEQ